MDIDLARADKTVEVNSRPPGLDPVRLAGVDGRAAGAGASTSSSVGGLSVEPGIGWYNVTKAAVVHLTRQLADELGPGVRVNALAPGLVKTDFARALWEPTRTPWPPACPLRRLGEPDDIAKAALFLASDAASWITGHASWSTAGPWPCRRAGSDAVAGSGRGS